MALDLETLNDPQRQAVECIDGPLLVLAGAGSGKTRVLTYRIAHMIEDKSINPWEILAITFTNKAALEMRERLASLIGSRSSGMWVCTFHSMCVKILRQHAEILGFTNHFSIYDADDQKRLIKTIMVESDINPKVYIPSSILGRISAAKNKLMSPGDFASSVKDPVGKVAAKVYGVYQDRLKASNAMDFDDLLLYTYLLFKFHKHVLEAYQNRFAYIMVDEYQDTNHAQYLLTKMLAEKSKNIMVVGDDDQSIYSWRGADIKNILDFEADYPNAKVIKLEQNYRSTANILNAANSVIANNGRRKQKKLFTDSNEGDLIGVYVASDERDEGRWIAGEIEKKKAQGTSYSSAAILYRTNAQSRILEDMLLRAGIPYRIVGGTKFFDRKEVRDVMAYLSLVVNPADDLSFERVINVPRRGIGKSTLDQISSLSQKYNTPMSIAATMLLSEDGVRSSTKTAISQFLQILSEARSFSGDLRKVVEHIVDLTKMIETYKQEGTDEAQSRIDNIKELYGVVEEYSSAHASAQVLYEPPSLEDASTDEQPTVRELQPDSLPDFLEWVRLRTDLDSVQESDSAVTLMTIHSAKGLEFDSVYLAGTEEGIFPHVNTDMDPIKVEEERRLAYVAITRARKNLCITCAQHRQLYGTSSNNPPSRFISEIPDNLRKTIGLGSSGISGSGWEKRGSRRGIAGSGSEAGRGGVAYLSNKRSINATTRSTDTSVDGKRAGAHTRFRKGDRLSHKTFGKGSIIGINGDTITVKFDESGAIKKLLKDYAPIVKI